jgi:pimeloyl-ACP methyl ester carboxylesterase
VELTVDGKRTYVATGNKALDPEKETVVFLHGAGMDHTVWVLPTRYFARHQRNVLAVDLPGHGRSEGPLLETVEEMADWVVHLLDAAELDKTAVVGHSMGSLVALETTARHGKRVRSLVMVGTAVPMPVTDVLLDSAEANDHLAIDMLNVWGHGRSAYLSGNPTPGMWMMGVGLRLLERAGPGVIHNDLRACNSYVTGLENAAQVRCPTLLILGDKDAMTPPRAARKVAEAIPDAETVVLTGAGHAMLSERPDPLLDQLIRMV